jgi:hypothetical protein
MAWLRVRTESVLDVRWAAIAMKLKLRPGDVGLTVLALAAAAARAKLEIGTPSIEGFDWHEAAVYFGTEAEQLMPIADELVRRGIIDASGVMVTGEDWDAYVTSTERVRRKRSKDDGGATDETLHQAPSPPPPAQAQAVLKRSGRAAEGPSGPALPRQGPLRTQQEVAAAGQGAPGRRLEPPAAASTTHETVAAAVHELHTTRKRVLAQPGTPGTSSVDTTEALLQALVAAAHGNVRRDPATGGLVEGILDLRIIDRLMKAGADLDRDILPAITATVAFPGQPSIPRWDLPWLVDEIRRNTQARGEPDPYPAAPRPRNPNLSSSPTRAPS